MCKRRLAHLAGFLHWDPDPYLVITDDGRLVWMVDGYTTSLSHPYSATLPVAGLDEGANYIRNAVKATVDAYTGKMSLYVFDPSDPIIQAYQKLFPSCSARFRDARRPAPARPLSRSSCFARRRRPTAPSTCAIRRCSTTRKTFGKSRATCSASPDNPKPMSPTYVVATLPGEKEPEFLLMLPFTPARQGQPDRLDGRPLRWRPIGRTRSSSSFRSSN